MTNLPQATQATASIGMALSGEPRPTNTLTKFALCTDSDLTNPSLSKSQLCETTTADFADMRRFTTYQTSEIINCLNVVPKTKKIIMRARFDPSEYFKKVNYN